MKKLILASLLVLLCGVAEARTASLAPNMSGSLSPSTAAKADTMTVAPDSSAYSVPLKNAINGLGVNLDRRFLPKTRKCIANVKAGSGRCLFVLVGDSTQIGIDGSGVANWPNEGDYLARLLTNKGIPAYQNGFSGNSTGGVTAGSRVPADPRMSLGAWVGVSNVTLGGASYVGNVGTPFSFTPTEQIDTCKVFYSLAQANGTTLTAGSGTPQFLAANGGSYNTKTATTTLGNNGCYLNDVTGATSFQSMIAYNSAVSGVDIMNAGWWGSRLSDWKWDQNAYSSKRWLVSMQPNLIIIKAGLNDATVATPLSQFKSDLSAFVSSLLVNSDVILETQNPASSVDQTAYIQAMYDVAISLKIPLVDNYSAMGSYTLINSLGFMADTVHPSTQGYSDMAVRVSRLIE